MSAAHATQKVYLSLGSNVGDRAANLRTAMAALSAAGVRVTKVSSIYETEPVDLLQQPWFLNCLVEGETEVEAVALLRELRGIERRMGSQKPVARGPRLIDLDILLYGAQTIATPELQVPHPRMHLRRFVLEPLAEIAPQLRHPYWSGTAAELLANSKDQSVVRRMERSSALLWRNEKLCGN
jgi:2-amino-4-hydroxy-6-hydroxymethyldihydropteridine diphosphokinase